MKERFWFAYYWLMISYLVLALVTIVDSKRTETYLPMGKTCEELDAERAEESRIRKEYGIKGMKLYLKEDNCQPRERPARVNNSFQFFNDILFFGFIENQSFTEEMYERKVNNYYPFILVLLMTLIRFVSIGKHIWQRP